MSIETEFPSLTRDGAMLTATAIAFYQDGYDVVVNRIAAARGPAKLPFLALWTSMPAARSTRSAVSAPDGVGDKRAAID